MKRSSLFLLALVTLAACSQAPSPTTNPPTVSTPTLTLTPASINVNAGNPAVFFSANVQNSSETVTWVYSGPGSVTPSSGLAASYTPPAKVKTTESGSLTATLGSTGVTATAPIVIYPANVTPPAEPPPTNPNPPANPPTTPDPTVTIAPVSPLMRYRDGPATATLNASVSNAPDGTTYQWTAEGTNADKVSFTSPTSEDTTATFSVDGTYALRLTVTAGSKSATATAEVMIESVPVLEQDVVGVWTLPETAALYDSTLDLKQTREDVTGTLTNVGGTFPLKGTFDGTTLKLDFTGLPDSTINAIVSGDTMTGTWDDKSGSDPFTATR